MSEEPSVKLRDFIYLDVEQVKSLLSQIDQGLLTDRSDSVGSNLTSEGRIGISIPALMDVGGAGQYLTTEQSIETRTLHDHVYNQTEERLLALDRVKRIPEDLDVATLVNSEPRERISNVEYVLVTGRIVLYDYDYMLGLTSEFNDILRSLIRIEHSSKFTDLTGKDRQRALHDLEQQSKSALLDDIFLADFNKFISLFYKGRLAMKIQPSDEMPNVRLSGPLQRELLRDKLEDIRFKFGSAPSDEWKVFGQIAAVPVAPKSRLPKTSQPKSPAPDLDQAFEVIFEAVRGLEDQFRVTYPEIAITPIALYRD